MQPALQTVGSYAALRQLNWRQDNYAEVEKYLHPAAIRFRIKAIAEKVGAHVKTASDLKQKPENASFSLVDISEQSVAEKEAKQHEPTYILAEKASQIDKLFITRITDQAVSLAEREQIMVDRQEMQTMAILFALRDVQGLTKELVEKYPSLDPVAIFKNEMEEEYNQSGAEIISLFNKMKNGVCPVNALLIQNLKGALEIKQALLEKVQTGSLSKDPVLEKETVQETFLNIMHKDNIGDNDMMHLQAVLDAARAAKV